MQDKSWCLLSHQEPLQCFILDGCSIRPQFFRLIKAERRTRDRKASQLNWKKCGECNHNPNPFKHTTLLHSLSGSGAQPPIWLLKSNCLPYCVLQVLNIASCLFSRFRLQIGMRWAPCGANWPLKSWCRTGKQPWRTSPAWGRLSITM